MGCAWPQTQERRFHFRWGWFQKERRGPRRSPAARWSAPSPSPRQGRAVPGPRLQADEQREQGFLQWSFDPPNVTRQAGDKCQAPCDSRFPQEMPCAGIHTGKFLAGLFPGSVPITDTAQQLGFGKWWVRLVGPRLQPPAPRQRQSREGGCLHREWVPSWCEQG